MKTVSSFRIFNIISVVVGSVDRVDDGDGNRFRPLSFGGCGTPAVR
jgi:hypothetical protein